MRKQNMSKRNSLIHQAMASTSLNHRYAHSNVAAPAVAVVRRDARAARAVSMTRAMNLALDDDAVAVVAVVVCDEESQNGRDEEEDDVPVPLLEKRRRESLRQRLT